MKRAAEYFRDQVALRGGYVYYYSPDLKTRLGEGPASSSQIWVQPPGTPTVGLAYLDAYRATRDPFYLDAATAAAEALVYGQLESGAWTNSIDFDPTSGQAARYRNGRGGGRKSRNFSTLDDGISQAALRLLMHVDQAHDFRQVAIHEAAQIALDRLLAAQFPNGGFPQGWDEQPAPRPDPSPARYPDYDWKTEGRIKNYWDMYTLNDGLAGSVADVLIDAHAIYGEARYKRALERLGEFLLLAQMPDPQPAWAQQYNYRMQPIWARRFEPAAIAGRESQDVLETLLKIHRVTGNPKYLEPIPRALTYLRRSQLADGRLARYYELQSNRPLYMFRRGKNYTLTYDDGDLPQHYGWKVASRLNGIERDYKAARTGQGREQDDSAERAAEVRRVLDALDDQARWISAFDGEPLVGQPKFSPGERYLSSGVFSRNLELLSAYLQEAGGE
jgi:PelA/Pel-15E family pectate lyase